jgi:hypothetical protein
MKSVRSVLFAFAILFLAASAQAQQTPVKANIPFDFVVGDKTYAAGEYVLKSASIDNPLVRITTANGDQSGVSNTIPTTVLEPARGTKLVFHRVGDTYFLSQLWIEGYDYGREFLHSRNEKLLAKNHTSEDVVISASLTR